MKISIDFDGTICYDRYPDIGPLQPYAVEIINKLHSDGHYLIINTCREGDRLNEAVNFLLEKGIRFHRVNDNHPEAASLYGWSSRKIFADVYIDDRNIGGLPSWNEIYDRVRALEEPKGGLSIAGRFRDRLTGDQATATDIFFAYPDGVKTLLIEAKFDGEHDTRILDAADFDKHYDVIK